MTVALINAILLSISRITSILEALVFDLFLRSMSSILGDHVASTAESMPLVSELLRGLLNNIETYVPVVASSTFFEFCCASGLLAVVLFSLVKWFVGLIK